jgi:cbb3-type cytochrome oxidase subunit 3
VILGVVAIVIALISVGVNYWLLRPKAKNLARAHIDSVYHMHEAKARYLRDEARYHYLEAEKVRSSALTAAEWAQAALAKATDGE